MRKYRVKVNDRVYSVVLEQTASDRFQASLEGTIVDLELVSKNGLMTWSLRSDGSSLTAHTRTLQHEVIEAWLAGIPFSAIVQAADSSTQPPQTEKPLKHLHGGQIRALMPGRVTSVLVKSAEHVEIGTPLLILEAMKMQNEISSPVSGVVRSIQVVEGQTVRKDTLLMEIA